MNVVSLIIGACSLHRDKWRVAVHECVLCLASVCVNWICVKAFDQCEYLSMVSDGTLDEMPMKQRKKFTGTNQGNKIGDLKLPALDSLWKLDKTMRKEMFTDKGKMPATFWIEVGGNNPDGSQGPGRGGGKVQKETNMLEPVFWHASDPDYFEELAHSYCLSQIYDLTPAEGTAALVFNKLQIPYVGVCLTQLHKEFLSERLEYKHMIQMFSIEPALAAKFPDFSPTQPTSSSPRPPATAPKAAPKGSGK